MKPIKQTVYLPVEVEDASGNYYDSGEEKPYYEIVDANNGERIDELVNEQEGYFFTPEQLNEYTQSVIKQALETAAEKAKVVKDLGEDSNGTLVYEVTEYYYDETGYPIYTEKQSITNTFEETFKLYQV